MRETARIDEGAVDSKLGRSWASRFKVQGFGLRVRRWLGHPRPSLSVLARVVARLCVVLLLLAIFSLSVLLRNQSIIGRSSPRIAFPSCMCELTIVAGPGFQLLRPPGSTFQNTQKHVDLLIRP